MLYTYIMDEHVTEQTNEQMKERNRVRTADGAAAPTALLHSRKHGKHNDLIMP